MPRTIVYRPRGDSPGRSPILFGGPAPAPSEPHGESPTKPTGPSEMPDSYTTRVIKFVPAEVVAFFAPTANAVSGNRALLLAVGGIGLIATPLYLWYTARDLPADQRPPRHFYILSLLAFVPWALATSPVAGLFGVERLTASVLLGAAVLLLPAVDALLTRGQSPASGAPR